MPQYKKKWNWELVNDLEKKKKKKKKKNHFWNTFATAAVVRKNNL